MKTLSQHNEIARTQADLIEKNKRSTGVACDSCGTEMLRDMADVALKSANSIVTCPKCGFSGQMSTIEQ